MCADVWDGFTDDGAGGDQERGEPPAARATHVPIQPLERDEDGVIRFRKNAIVDYLLGQYEGGLNELACKGFSDDDWTQLAQLIGYSLDGFGELSYVSDGVYDAAAKIAEALIPSEAGRENHDHVATSAPERFTELRPAWAWTCDACGRDNYGESLLQKVGDLRSRGRVVSRKANDDDDVMTLPDVVTCSHCGEEYADTPPDGFDGVSEDDDCDDVLDDDYYDDELDDDGGDDYDDDDDEDDNEENGTTMTTAGTTKAMKKIGS